MPINKITFTGTVYDENDKLLNKIIFTIKYYDLKESKWIKLVDVTINKGNLAKDWPLSKEKKTGIEGNIINNNLPTFSLAVEDNKNAMNEILNYTVVGNGEMRENANTIQINFGIFWYFNNYEKYKFTFLQRPSDIETRRTLIAAFDNKDILKNYDASEHKLLVVSKTSNEDNGIESLINEIDSLRADNALKKETIDEYKRKETGYVPKALPLNSIYNGILDDIHTSSEQNLNKGYKLSNVSLKLKAFAEKDADGVLRLQLIDSKNANLTDSQVLSEIQLNMTENQVFGKIEKLQTPNVIGLTETSVKKLLISYGLKLVPVYQYERTTNDQVIGQAIEQFPKANQEIEVDENLTVIFLKRKT